ncbi:MAG: hypothetical protein PHP25_03325 [Candidatus Moranbacteria bacterium]|nr:hypothetical protein [Candidatus Moranbacteria bacterium]
MSVKNIFSHGKKLSQRKFGGRYSKDARMREVFGNQKIAKALDKTSERNEFYDMLKSKKEGGVTKQEMKEALGEWMTGKGRTISRKEAYAVAKEFFGDEKVKYVMPKKKVSSSAFSGSSGAFGGAGGTDQNIQKSYGPFGGVQTSGKSVISAGELPMIYKKASANPASSAPKILASPISAAKIIAPPAGGSSVSAQSGQNDDQKKEDRAESERKAQSKKRRRSISAGLAAIVDMMGPVKSEDSKNNKGDFFRAINATRRNTRN